jgi:mono/diheme cytochrome c family protein
MRKILFVLLLWTPALFAQTAELPLETGEDVFRAACIGCHGPGGKGQPETTLGFVPPDTFPDFSDCNGSTRERVFDWRATIHQGGPGRGFSEIMPSFTEALTPAQIERVMEYLRSLCTERAWPLGELNLPRALITEKAFPEDEWVLGADINATGERGLSTEFIFEKRFGAKNQIEIAAPFMARERGPRSWVGGIGDIVLGYKRVLAHSGRTGSILSVQGEVITPTGNRFHDLGSGTTTFETFAAFGQIFPRLAFIQIQTGAEFPTDTEKASRAVYWRTAIGKTLAQNEGFGRAWTPMTEVLADRDLETGARTNWDLVPQMQVTLNRRQHIRANAGFRFPLNNTAGRSKQLVFYLLWDFFDGGLRDGW